MRACLFVLTAAAALALFAAGAGAGPKEDILAADKAFCDLSVAQGSHVAFLAFMADDVRLFQGAHPPLMGKTAAQEYFAREEKTDPDYPNTRLEWTPAEAEVSPDGVLGWTRGSWTETVKQADGRLHKLSGYYVTEWRRQRDATYKFVLDIGGVYRP